MNATRLKEVKRAYGMLEEAKAIIEECANDEREAFDNMSEKAQEGERGQQISDIADELEAALGSMESATDSLGNIEGLT